jgi:geranylgeranyl diphosphate synthase type II
LLGGRILGTKFSVLSRYLDDSRQLVLDEIRTILPHDRQDTGGLYELMLDYPLRYGKALRPALAIAVCRAFGGSLAAVLPTAAVLELYHNAFLIHDDIEDQSYLRRAEPTLNRLHGAPTAINVGDAMLATAMQPLLDNIRLIGLGKALKILRLVARMARESAEGQMLELRWISSGAWDQDDADYARLVHKKTGWYSFIAPVMIGAVIAGLDSRSVERIGRRFIPLGLAFQIQDDVLNLVADKGDYGKDLWGDLWEGKHTLMLIHTLRVAAPEERRRALDILKKPHPSARSIGGAQTAGFALMDALVDEGAMSAHARVALAKAWSTRPVEEEAKSEGDVQFLRELVLRHGGIVYAKRMAERYARRFQREISEMLEQLSPSDHRQYLADLADFTIERQL